MFPLKHSAPSTSRVKLSDKSPCEEEASTSMWRESNWFYLVIDERRVGYHGGRKSTQGRKLKESMFLFFFFFLEYMTHTDTLNILGSLEHRILCQHVSRGGSQVVM